MPKKSRLLLDKPDQPLKCSLDSLETHCCPVTIEMKAARSCCTSLLLPRNPDGSERLEMRPAAGSGDATDGNREITVAMLEGACCHLQNDRLADCAMPGKCLSRNPEHRLLGPVAVGDKTLFEPATRPGQVGTDLRDPAARAGLGSHEHLLLCETRTGEPVGQLPEPVFIHGTVLPGMEKEHKQNLSQ